MKLQNSVSAVGIGCGIAALLLWLACLSPAVAQEDEGTSEDNPAETALGPLNENDDDTPDVETESSVDGAEERKGLRFGGDLRPTYEYFDLDERDGLGISEDRFGARVRLDAEWGITRRIHVGARLAGRCFIEDCPLEFVMDSATPGNNGLTNGQFTFDEIYLHWFRKERFDVAVGRLQTRFVLRGGVYGKSLDRNDSNNVNVTWTDGLQAVYRDSRGWASNFVWQRNSPDGTGSIRRGSLNFDDSSALNTYFVGFENIRHWGLIVQRGFDVSYLPDSLLMDGDVSGRREDYWGLVGRVVMRWPQRSQGLRLRAGTEVGYAPATPTSQAVGLEGSGNADGLAWDVVVSAMDMAPGHSLGLNYARTGPSWFLSPQFRPNEELMEIRYQWRPANLPLLEVRVRRREDLEQLVGTTGKRSMLDLYVRLTWEFSMKKFLCA